MKKYAIVVGISVVSFLLHGYQFAVTDQAIFIPYIQKIHNPSLYQNDILFQQSSSQTSIFYILASAFLNFVDIQTFFIFAYAITHILFFLVLYKLSSTLLKNQNLAFISLLPFLLPKFIAGANIYTFDTYFGYRIIGTIFLLYFLKSLFEHKYISSTVIIGMGSLFHALSFIPIMPLLPVFILKNSKSRLKKIIISTSIILIFTIPLTIISKFSIVKHMGSVFDSGWLSIIKQRDDYLFISTWKSIEWAALFFYLFIILINFQKLRKSIKSSIVLIVSTSFGIFLLCFLLLEILKIPLFAQFQLSRSIIPLAYISFALSPLLLITKNTAVKVAGSVMILSLACNLYVVLFISSLTYVTLLFRAKIPVLQDGDEANLEARKRELRHLGRGNLFLPKFQKYQKQVKSILAQISKLELLKSKSPGPRFIVILYLTVIIITVATTYKSYSQLSQKFQIPKPYNPWIDVQLWAKNNVDKSKNFVVLPRQIGFRIFSQRSIIADEKDGAVVMYDPLYAKKWYGIFNDFRNFYTLDKTEFKNLKDKYNFDYIVTVKEHELGFEIVYKNNYYVVYKVN